jgi:DNA replication regulator SLD3
MSVYALQTKTMLHTNFKSSTEVLRLPVKHDAETKSKLPSKRKRDTICGLGTFSKPFTIKPCPKLPDQKPHTFRPVRVIRRSQLPLSFLDTSTDETLVTNRLFSAHINVLEEHTDAQNNAGKGGKVLIARHETRRTLYAVERVQTRMYTLCKLAGWLKEKELTDLWDPESAKAYPKHPQMERLEPANGEWWNYAVVETTQAEKPAKRIRLSMLRPQHVSNIETLPVDPQRQQKVAQKAVQGLPEPIAVSTGVSADVIGAFVPPTPVEQLEGLVEQYLNAIYLSKMSLAYFAKGPIARIRNAFTSSDEGAPPTHELVSFLRSMLLGHKAEEKKYREKLAEVIKSIPPGSYSDEDLADTATKTKKSKKKVKLSREGVYPREADIVKKWWISELPNPDLYGEETMDQRIKRRLADLRVREALAQMILMLEIVSLESLATYTGPPGHADDTGETQTQGESQTQPKKRKKKLDDISLLLDLLLDKLCIWQSVEQEGVVDIHSKYANQDAGTGHAGGNDRLQGFCVEVIIPFYMHRLPEQARTVNKKLGGPTTTSPPKRKAMKPPTTSHKSGEPKEPDAKKSRRSLARVATDTTGQTGQRRAPSLHRSATDSALTDGIKREGSEAPLSAIPFQRSPSNAARQSMSHMKLLKGRQIDLDTRSAAEAAKMKQKKRVEEEIQEAIIALKKPNRGLAVGSYVDEAEKRGLGGSSKSKKPTNTMRRIVKDVQVSATPRIVRTTKGMVSQTPIQQSNPFMRPRQTEAPPSSDFCIPSSAARLQSSIVPATAPRSATSRTLAGLAVTETPSKPPMSRAFKATVTSNTVFATPSKPRAVSPDSPLQGLDATPTKGLASSPPNIVRSTPRALFATPPKHICMKDVAESPLPASSNAAGDDQGPSIYDALGWNDDDDF